MRLTLQTNRSRLSTGFTLIEVLIIAPIVVLVIGGFIALIMALVGDVLLTRDQNVMAYETQDALDRIEQDTRIGTQFLNTSRTLPAPQGSDDGVAAFTSSSALIMGALATDKNPADGARKLVYYADQPAACGANQAQNRIFINKIIYFIKNGSLWRRVVVPPYDTNTPAGAFSLCATPWQQNSCAPGYTLVPPCETNDAEVMKNIKTMEVKYYDTPNAANELTGTDILNASTIDVTLTGEQTTTGKATTSSGSIRASKINSIEADVPLPASPVASHSFSDSPVPGVNFTWSSVQYAASYQLSYKVNGGGWVNANVSGSTAYYFVPAFRTDTVLFKVASVNTSGTSPDATDTATMPSWSDPTLLSGWVYWGLPHAKPAYTKTSDGVVVVKGIVKSGSTVAGNPIFILPVGYRPSHRLIFLSHTNHASTIGRVDVYPTGEVVFWNGANGVFTLDMIRFLPTTTSVTWTNPTFTGTTWHNYDPPETTYANFRMAKDASGRVHAEGLLEAGNSANGQLMANIPTTFQPGQHLILPAVDRSAYIGGYNLQNNNAVVSRAMYLDFTAIHTIYYPASYSGWSPVLTASGGWGPFGGLYSTLQYAKSADDIVIVKGLLKSGTVASGTVVATLPPGYRPKEKLIFNALSNNSAVRLDVDVNGQISIVGSGANITFLSLDSISFIAEQ